jgi:hypothetical protein
MTVVMVSIRCLLALLFLVLAAADAHAAEVAYPPGSRIGLVPASGMVTSRNFFGFEDADNNVAVILVSLPGDAYAELNRTVTADALKKQGLTLESREAMSVPTGNAFLVIGRQEVEKIKLRKWILIAAAPTLTALVTVQVPDTSRGRYPDAAIRTMLASLTIRGTVPVDEQLGLLPFRVGELAGFRVGGVIPGRAVMLSDAVPDASGQPAAGKEPHMIVNVGPGAPAQASEREAFAREVFATIPNIKDIRLTSSEALRMSGQQGHQIIANAKDGAGADPLTIVQWLRFGSGGYLQMVGIARADSWTAAYQRFRAVRDGVEAR